MAQSIRFLGYCREYELFICSILGQAHSKLLRTCCLSCTTCYCQFFSINLALLGYLTERITSTAIKHKRQRTQCFSSGKPQRRKPRNFLKDRISTKIEKPKTVSDIPTAVVFFLSSPSVFSFLNYALHLSVHELYVK